MKLRTLLGAIDEAETAGDLTVASPVFAVIRNTHAALERPDAWDAISIVRVDVRDGAVVLTADESDGAKDMSVSALRARVKKLPGNCLQYRVFVGGLTIGEPTSQELVPVVEAYGDENGLGLMVQFEGYEAWLRTQS